MNNLKTELEKLIGIKLKNNINQIEDSVNKVYQDTKATVSSKTKPVAVNIDSIKSNTKHEKIKNAIFEASVKKIIANPFQPRKYFDSDKIKELSISIKNYGVFTPILLKKHSSGFYIIAGERRFRAVKLLGLQSIPGVLIDITDNQMEEISLLENIQREDLTAIEEGKAYKSIMTNQNITQERLSSIVGKSRSHIANTIGLLKLPEKIQNYVLNGKLLMGHVRPLITLSDNELINKITKRIFSESLTTNDVEHIVKGYKLHNLPKVRKKIETPDELKYVEDHIRNILHTKVLINKKTIHIKYRDIKHLNLILKKTNLLPDEDL